MLCLVSIIFFLGYTRHVIPSRNLCQGDPLSPEFLFVLEGLPGLLKRAVEVSAVRGLKLCEGAPVISHLLFADDTLIFCSVEESQALAIKELPVKYEKVAG